MFRTLLLSTLLSTACAGSNEAGEAFAAPVATDEPVAKAEQADSEQVVASWDGGQVTQGELREQVANDLRAMEIQYQLQQHETLNQALRISVMGVLLESETQRQGLVDVDALLTREVEEKVAQPSEEEVQEFFRMVSRQLGGLSYAEARPFLVQDLMRQAQVERYREYVEELETAANVSYSLAYPDLPRIEVPIGEYDPVIGAADAPVTIIQFAEYECPYCNKVVPTLDRVLEEYDGKVRMVFKDFPLSNHGRAMPAAIAAHCAGDQDRYWEMNRVLLANQQALEDADLVRYAGDLSLDVDAFQVCLTSGKFEPTIAEDMAHGSDAGVSATPSFLINGISFSGAQPYERFSSLIDQELAADGD
ncbi:MAG: DsbA family protein [Deltaproteobacteria bacterium]|nr:DsbA family protein [Deltaproteobacteria bacterium]